MFQDLEHETGSPVKGCRGKSHKKLENPFSYRGILVYVSLERITVSTFKDTDL
jgi:hypothetical protein